MLAIYDKELSQCYSSVKLECTSIFAEFYEKTVLSFFIKILCALSNCSMGYLDPLNKSFNYILRSHSEIITHITYNHIANVLISISLDMTIRLWLIFNFIKENWDFRHFSNF